jgi:aspartokinase/homoserine dehydrogenase 1
VGIANSRFMHFDPEGIDLTKWKSILENSKERMSWVDYEKHLVSSHIPNAVFVDCSSNQDIANSYAKLLSSNVAVVTPNKKANSGTMETFKQLKSLSTTGKTKFLYDANVGAGLPILHTIRDMRTSGDQLVKVEAVLSGTLSYIFNSFKEGALFSTIVREAQKKGYTEPDPRDDLNGMDFARKLLIIAREAGYDLEMNEIDLKGFLPPSCLQASSVEDFYTKLLDCDTTFAEMNDQAASEGKKLRFIGSFDKGCASISLQAVGKEHPFYNLSGNDNIVAIWSKYYSKNPLVIQGPGAGSDVTAARVLQGVIQSAT